MIYLSKSRALKTNQTFCLNQVYNFQIITYCLTGFSYVTHLHAHNYVYNEKINFSF